eukprot:Gb_07677 [translate_table: standard]
MPRAMTVKIAVIAALYIYAVGSPGGGKQLDQGQSWTVEVPAGTTQGRFWGRTGCNFDGSGRVSCKTGDCGGLLNCQGWGHVTATLAEYALNQYQNQDFYDISLVDGFNLRLVADGCKSACAAFNKPEYCCTGAFLNTCSPTNYSNFFKTECPQAYSYAKDDATSTFSCQAGTNYKIVFCG